MEDLEFCGCMLGEFVLRERIGGGGFGTAFRAEQLLLRRGVVVKRDVVVKVLRPWLRGDETALRRFRREAELASQLDHPYAAHIYAFGVEENGVPWIAMELVHGVTLKDWLETNGPMPLDQFVPFFDCVAQVVHAAHELGIVHRDLKPSNVMVIEDAGRLVPKLLDFGIAKVHRWSDPLATTDTDMVTAGMRAGRTCPEPLRRSPAIHLRLTTSGAGMGSPAYMAPEQFFNAHTVGSAADIYALGVLIYETLTGRLPFSAESRDEYYQRHCHEPVPLLGGNFSPDLDRILQRALAKSPYYRHGSVLELASALRTSPREQLRASAQRWDDRSRPPGLLWGADMLAAFARGTRTPLSQRESAFLAASQRRVRRSVWVRRSLVAIAAMIPYGALQCHAWTQTRLAQQRAEVTLTQAALEQGRAALLHGEPEAAVHLAEAYKRDPTPLTAFMFSRALQPRLAEQLRFVSSAGRMWDATFSPDGHQLVVTDDQGAQVRDAQTGRLLFALSHGDTVYQAVYSANGARLITAGGDGSVRIWEAANGTLMRELKHDGRRLRYGKLAALPDGRLVAAIDLTGEVTHVWDAATGALLAELHNDASEFLSLAFSAEGRWLATSGGNDVRVFDARTWTQVLVVAGPGIHGVSWDPTGPRLLTGTSRGDASIWTIPSGTRSRHLREIGEPVDAVAFSPNGKLVVAASRDGAEQVWSAASGTLQSQGNYLRDKIRSVEFDPMSKLIVAAGTSGAVVVADAALGMPVTVLEGPRNVVWGAHFDPSSRRVIGASWDGTARVWDAASPYRRWSSPPISDDCGLGTSPEPDRRFVAIGCRDHTTRVWDTARDQLLAELPSVTPVDGDFASAFPAVSAAGDRAAIARGNAVEIYELPGGRRLRTVVHPAAVNAVAFASTGRDLVSGAIDGSLLVTQEGYQSLALPGFPGGVDATAFLSDGRVVVANAGKRLRVYAPGGAVLAELEVPDRVLSLRTSPEGHRLVTLPSYTGKPATPMLLDLERYQVIAPLGGHVGRVFSARFEAGEIFTAGADGTARRWDGVSGQLLQTYQGSSRFLADATLTPDGSMVVAGGGDGLLRFWDTATARPLWTLPAHKSPLIGLHFEGTAIITRGFSGDASRWVLPPPEQVIEASSDREAALSWPNAEKTHP